MQKIIIIALLFACAYSVQVNVSAGTAAGFVVSMGVAQKCHRSCLTCSTPLATGCETCVAGSTASNGLTKQGDGTCGCATGFHVGMAGTVAICEATAVSPWTGTAAECVKVVGMYSDITTTNQHFCVFCPNECHECTTATACKASTPCWAAQAVATTTCTYVITTSYVVGMATAYDQTGATLSVVNGYFYVGGTTFTQTACNVGCLTCDLAATTPVLCSTCATGFVPVSTTKLTCECPAAGFFTTAAAVASLGACTACQAGCTTCSSATVCTVCDSSHMLGATTASSSTCETSVASVVAASSSATTDGESSMTSTTGTDAATTNGVLITAASVLLAVILA